MITVAIYIDERRKPCVRRLPALATKGAVEYWREIKTICRHIGGAGGRFVDVYLHHDASGVDACMKRFVAEGYEDMTGKKAIVWNARLKRYVSAGHEDMIVWSARLKRYA
jgi:hypothetical protein